MTTPTEKLVMDKLEEWIEERWPVPDAKTLKEAFSVSVYEQESNQEAARTLAQEKLLPLVGSLMNAPDTITRMVCEMPYKSSPDDDPEKLNITANELVTIIERYVEGALEDLGLECE